VILPLDERGDVWKEFAYYQHQNNYQYQLIHHMQHPLVHATLHAETSAKWFAQVPKEFQCKTDQNQHRYLRPHPDLHTHICIYANSTEGRQAMEQYLYTPIPSKFCDTAGTSTIKSILNVYPPNTPPASLEPYTPDATSSGAGSGNGTKKRKAGTQPSQNSASPRSRSNNGGASGAGAGAGKGVGADAMTWIQCEDCERWIIIDVSAAKHLEDKKSSFFCQMVSPPIICLNPEERAAEEIKWQQLEAAQQQTVVKTKRSPKGQGGGKDTPMTGKDSPRVKEKEYPYTVSAFDDSTMSCNSCGRLAYRRDVLKGRLCSCSAGG